LSYDFEPGSDRSPPRVPHVRYAPHDLEAIVTLLELGAIYLTADPGSDFTFEELLVQAREIGGSDFVLEEADARIVLDSSSFLKRSGGRYSLR
jgi:hypothetical protein